MRTVIFANIVNGLMIEKPSLEYARRMNAVTPRKIWLATPGDIVVTPEPIPEYFRHYAEETLCTSLRSVRCYSPAGDDCDPLAKRTIADTRLMEMLRRSAAEGANLLYFCLDLPTFDLANALEFNIAHYSQRPGQRILDACYRINTKNGFRQTAEALGLQTVPGRFCDASELGPTVTVLGAIVDAVIIKANRSSNGFGHTVVRTKDQDPEKLNAEVDTIRRRLNFATQFVVEEYVCFSSLPSVELEISDDKVTVTYICDQRCVDNAWTGMTTPPESPSLTYIEELTDIGLRFGRHVQRLGFRGACDVDCGATADGRFFVLESNFRRTGGTYLHALTERLLGVNYLNTHVWWADARVGREMDFSEAVEALSYEGLRFDHSQREGVILTADTTRFDRKWRYLILAKDHSGASKIEHRLERVLKLASDKAAASPE
jgi:Pre ATP-grasp domain/PGM1 C-terminal domain/Carbamoyl-phosphate synthase L chain, ATP binding domain